MPGNESVMCVLAEMIECRVAAKVMDSLQEDEIFWKQTVERRDNRGGRRAVWAEERLVIVWSLDGGGGGWTDGGSLCFYV